MVFKVEPARADNEEQNSLEACAFLEARLDAAYRLATKWAIDDTKVRPPSFEPQVLLVNT